MKSAPGVLALADSYARSQHKCVPSDDVCQVSDESALSFYERGPKVGFSGYFTVLGLHVYYWRVCQFRA